MRFVYVYVFDAYCGWSYGFAPTLAELVRRHPDVEVEVVSGGLFTGGRRVPIRSLGYVQGANAKISELTGAEFGDGYEFEAVILQPMNQAWQSCDGRRAISARIVEQDDVAAALRFGFIVAAGARSRDPRHDVVDDRVHSRALPVLAVDVEPNGNVAAALRLPHGQDLVGRARRSGCPDRAAEPAMRGVAAH